MEFCKECKVGSLSTFFEGRLGVCADCCAKLLDHSQENSKKNKELVEKNASLVSDLENLKFYMDAERLGYLAAQSGFPESENPYANDSEKNRLAHDMWINGWIHEALIIHSKHVVKIVGWSVDTINLIDEIAKGYGQNEISEKLRLVIEKLEGVL